MKMWIDDVTSWTKLDSYEKVTKAAENRLKWRALRRYSRKIEVGTPKNEGHLQ